MVICVSCVQGETTARCRVVSMPCSLSSRVDLVRLSRERNRSRVGRERKDNNNNADEMCLTRPTAKDNCSRGRTAMRDNGQCPRACARGTKASQRACLLPRVSRKTTTVGSSNNKSEEKKRRMSIREEWRDERRIIETSAVLFLFYSTLVPRGSEQRERETE